MPPTVESRHLFGSRLTTWEYRYPVSTDASRVLKFIANDLKKNKVEGVLFSINTQTDFEDEDYFLTNVTLEMWA